MVGLSMEDVFRQAFDAGNSALKVNLTAVGAYPEVANYAALPNPTTVSGKIYFVKNTTGVIFKKYTGFYYSDGSNWIPAPSDIKDTFDDSVFRMFKHTDDTSLAAFDLTEISPSTTRTITAPNRNHQLGSIDQWVTGTKYILQDYVQDTNKLYRCTTAHTASALFSTDSSKWVAVGGSGGGGLTNPVDLLQYNTSPSVPTYAGGNTYWDATYNTLAVQTGLSTSTLQVGQENYVRVCNKTGAPIANGTVVYINSADAGTDMPTIQKALANEYNTSRIIGVTTDTIADGTCGFATSFGNVNGLDTSSYTAGQVIYLSPTVAGGVTATSPIGGNFIVMVGIVVKVDATLGKLLVYPRAQDYTNEAQSQLGWSSAKPTLSFTNATRTLSLSTGSEFHHYQYGVKYSKTSDSFPISSAEGLHFVYYNLGVLAEIVNPTPAQYDTIIRNNPTVSQIYWDASNNRADYVGNELHRFEFPALVHSYMHFLFSARYTSGLALNTISADASGTLNASAQFGVDSGAISDEDIFLPSPTITSTTGLPIYYLSGTTAAPTLRITSNAGYSVLTTGTGRLAYNTTSVGNYILAEADNNNFVLIHIFGGNHIDTTKRPFAIVGQEQYTTISNARAGAQTEIQNLITTGVVPNESKAIATVIFETSNSYSNAVKARIRSISSGVNYVDWRTTYFNGTSVGGGGGSGTTVFSDSTFQIFNATDATKKIQLDASGIATGTTRTITMPDANVNLGSFVTGSGTSGQVSYWNGTQAQTGDTALVYDITNDALKLGTGTPTITVDADHGYFLTKTTDSYLSNDIQNLSTGTSASSDMIINADNATDTTNYVDLGINGSAYNQAAYNIGAAGDAYLYNVSGNLAVGTASVGKVVKIHTGGTTTTNLRATIGDTVTKAENLIVTKDYNVGSIIIPSGYTAMKWGDYLIDTNDTLQVDGTLVLIG